MKPTGPVLRLVVALVYGFILIPIVIVLAVSFSADNYIVFPPSGWSLRWYGTLLATPTLFEAFRVSVMLAALVTVLALACGMPAAFLIARHRFRGRDALFGFFTAPLLLPTLVLALALLLAFHPWGLAATVPGLVLAHLTVTLPFVIRILTTAFANLTPDVEDAAATLGARPFTVFRRVTLPLVVPGLIAATALAFLLSFDETVISLFISGPRLQTLPVAVYHYVERRTDPAIAALSALMITGSIAIVVLVERMVGLMRAVGR
ncbi:MAG: ABC transporter permease [Alphaproteobacteria bacterium]|nr:ABC transporter permease [Alphaproteobacteria bacterium]